MEDILYHLNQNRRDYVFCGMIKLKNILCYVGDYKITETVLQEFLEDDEQLDISDIQSLSNWDVSDFCNAIDAELENRNYHNYKITPSKIINSLPNSIDNKEKIEILKKIFDFIS